MQLKSLLLATVLPLSLILAACNSGPSDSVKARQGDMKNWKDATGVMKDMVEAPETFDADKFKQEADFLAKDASNPWQYFDDENDTGGAEPTVWSDSEGFKAAAEQYKQATLELQAAAQTATSVEDILPAFSKVGENCKSCHEGFKAPQN
ncbi:c-type cytochrome [Psychrobacter lutiphocae]|uniref:c-type cytochrome n=1 Tax=Psychrobacter lutiphocae TaxID=540500 RepID=UPI00037A6F11|nr:cytochrome c [Psychrobacter lutiphocae]